MTLSQLVVLIAKQLDVSIVFEKLRESSMARRAHLKKTSSWTDLLCFCPQHFVKSCNVQYDVTKNILLPHRSSNKTMHHPKNSQNKMPPSSKMSHMTYSCPRRRPPNHTSPRNAISTSATMNDTSFQEESTRHPTSARKRIKKLMSWHCPQNLACVESTCPPRAPTWTLWNTMFYVTSHKNMLKLAMFSHVYEEFFPIWHDGF